MEPTPTETVHLAIDDLLAVVSKTAEDLRMFHTAVSGARIAALPPYPRATVLLTSRIIEQLKSVEHQLLEVMTALGLPATTHATTVEDGQS
jgi:hypothetical protein